MKSNWILKLKESKTFHYFILFMISFFLFLPLLKTPITQMHDGRIHVLRVVGIGQMIQEGKVLPFISPYYCQSFGYAINLFYPPLVTYGPLIFKLFLSSYLDSMRVFTLLTIFLSGISMYQFTHQVTKNKIMALVAGVLYIIAPYKLSNIYIRFALGEITAMLFIPVVFQGVYSLLNEDGKKHYYIAIGAIGLMLTHTITTFYTAILCILYLLFYLPKLKEKDIWKKGIINIVFILLITSFFTIPMLEHKIKGDYVIFDQEVMWTNTDFVSQQTIQPYQFLVNEDAEDRPIYQLGLPLILSLIVLVFVYKKIEERYQNTYTIFAFLGILCLYMCTKYFPWRILPDSLGLIQFPWRMLGFASFFLSFLGGVNIGLLLEKLKKNWLKLLLLVLILILMLITTFPMLFSFVTEEYQKDYSYEQSAVNKVLLNPYNINREYLPSSTYDKDCKPILERNPNIVELLSGQAEITDQNKQVSNLSMNFHIVQATEGTYIELPYLYYLGYTITLTQHQETTILPYTESEGGLIQVQLPEIVQGDIHISYTGTVLMKLSYLVSFISLIVFVIYIRRTKNEKVLEQ